MPKRIGFSGNNGRKVGNSGFQEIYGFTDFVKSVNFQFLTRNLEVSLVRCVGAGSWTGFLGLVTRFATLVSCRLFGEITLKVGKTVKTGK